MKAKTFGIVGAVGSPIIIIAAYELYSSGRPAFALVWGAIALVWAVLSAINFRTARRQRDGY